MNEDSVVAVLPAPGWFIHHERADGSIWREPVIGFAISPDLVGHPLVADSRGRVRATSTTSGETTLVPPEGLLRVASDRSVDVPAIDVEMTLATALKEGSPLGHTIETLSELTQASGQDIKERLQFLDTHHLIKKIDQGRYILASNSSADALRALRGRFPRPTTSW